MNVISLAQINSDMYVFKMHKLDKAQDPMFLCGERKYMIGT